MCITAVQNRTRRAQALWRFPMPARSHLQCVSRLIRYIAFFVDAAMNYSNSHGSFYLLQAVSFVEEHSLPQDDDHIDVIEIPPEADALIDLEDFDDDILHGEDQEKLFLPPNVPDTVELHQFDDETFDATATDQPKKKKQKTQNVKWKKMKPAYSKLPPSTDGANQRKNSLKDVLKNNSPVEIFELFFTEN